MRITVCLKEVICADLDLGYGRVSDTQMQKGLSFRLNPYDVQVLIEALRIKTKEPGVEIILVMIGPERVEKYLREGLAVGADKAIRIWEENFRYLSYYQKSKILARAVSLLGTDLVLVGARNPNSGSGLVGPLIAAWLDIPCICEAIEFETDNQSNQVTVNHYLSKSVQEKVMATLPVVLSIVNRQGELPYASLDDILASKVATITYLTIADLGITPDDLKKDPIRVIGTSFPKPRPRASPLDSSLPAFSRILALLQGGISMRRGEILSGNTDEVVDRIFELLVKENVIDLDNP